MLSTRSFLAGAALLSFTTLVGCASAGPDLNGPEGPDIMAAYSGDWVLVPSASEDLNGKMRDSMRGPAGEAGRGGMTGGRSGGGGRGGMSGGGRGGGMAGGSMDPEEMRRSMEVIRTLARVPGEVSLTLRPETVTLTEAATNVLVLTFGAKKERILQGGAILLGTAEWKTDGLEIEREMEMGGGIKDQMSLNEEGHLVLKREIDTMGRIVNGTLVYERKPGEVVDMGS